MWIDRRTFLEDKRDELEHQTYNLFPERWDDLYREQFFPGTRRAPGDYGQAFENGEAEIPVTDTNDLDRWLNTLGQRRGITGEQAMAQGDPEVIRLAGYAEGQGRRV